MGILPIDVLAMALRGPGVGWMLRGLGLDVAMVALPLHGPRRIAGRSGQGFLDGHPLWMRAALDQSLWDLRRLIGWLREQGAPRIAVVGLSLGGYLTALVAQHERIDGAIPIIPAVDLPAVMWREMLPRRRQELEESGTTREQLTRLLSTLSPLGAPPLVERERLRIIAAAHDRIIPPAHVIRLWDHWKHPTLTWFDGTHLSGLGRMTVRASLAEHLPRVLLDRHDGD